MSGIWAMIITDGRPGLIERTIESWRTAWGDNGLNGAVIIDDSQSADHARLLWEHFGGYKIIHLADKGGFTGAIRAGWHYLADHNPEWFFWLEDDFLFRRPIDVLGMTQVLGDNPLLAQLVLKRQPWNPQEKAAGGIVECWPDKYTEQTDGDHWWTEHDLFFSTNPSLCRGSILDLDWPAGDRSEQQFTQRALQHGYKFAFWGRKYAPPIIEHIGLERIGTGY